MRAVTIIHYTGATAKSHSVVASLAMDSKDQGHQVTVLDLAATTTIHRGFPPPLVARILGHKIFSPSLTEVLTREGIMYQALSSSPVSGLVRQQDQPDLGQALRSEMLTYFRLDHIPDNVETRNLERSLSRGMLQTYLALDALWSENPPDRVMIPNGRTSRQKAARLVAEHRGIEVLFYEDGRARPNSYYLGKTQPHDRVSSQAELREGFPLPPVETVTQQAAGWLEERMSSEGGTNSFSALWDSSRLDIQKGDEPLAVFFASSFDEFLAFGPMWSIDEWGHRFEAFDEMMSLLEKKGVALVLRLHPNLGSKSRLYFRSEVEQALVLKAAHPSLRIYWHNDAANSYDLVAKASYVIVERSTIGLEASLMGKPVWVTHATQWDQIADIRQVLRPSDLTDQVMNLWSPKPAGARQFVSYWINQEHPLRYDGGKWASWDLEKAPAVMKLAQLALPNSLRHKIHLLSLELARLANARFVPPRE